MERRVGALPDVSADAGYPDDPEVLTVLAHMEAEVEAFSRRSRSGCHGRSDARGRRMRRGDARDLRVGLPHGSGDPLDRGVRRHHARRGRAVARVMGPMRATAIRHRIQAGERAGRIALDAITAEIPPSRRWRARRSVSEQRGAHRAVIRARGTVRGRCQEGRPSAQPLTTRNRDETGARGGIYPRRWQPPAGGQKGVSFGDPLNEAQRIRPIQCAKYLHAADSQRG
jgi:hypothetical protein